MHPTLPPKFVTLATLAIWASIFIAEKAGDFISWKVILSLNPAFKSDLFRSIGREIIDVLHGPGGLSFSSFVLATVAKWTFALLISFICAICLRRVAETTLISHESNPPLQRTASRPLI